ncbi:hypothetical protein SAMN05421821_101263 [Mucilaginibacter lappiensis]|uniref:Uncharacterized protein n=1 Tax=Mucilaginibacter lappiensis TaxID=354630 RepID=A0ABR6PDJ3_9SPHI|nr:hypothetical protein [Mucilaginibacter lappiensis]SIP95921.1 hypothetical protein SAMN05421821_101263 [Mucilaginibacter lappiensis]
MTDQACRENPYGNKFEEVKDRNLLQLPGGKQQEKQAFRFRTMPAEKDPIGS